MINKRRLLAEEGHVASDTLPNPGAQKGSERKLTQQYRPIAVQAIAAVIPYQGQRKNAAYAPAASRHRRRVPSEPVAEGAKSRAGSSAGFPEFRCASTRASASTAAPKPGKRGSYKKSEAA